LSSDKTETLNGKTEAFIETLQIVVQLTQLGLSCTQ